MVKVRKKSDKVGFFRSKKVKFNVFKTKLKNNKDLKVFLKDMFELFLNGILGSLILIPCGIRFNVFIILAIGSGFFIFFKKLLPPILNILNSFSLIKISAYKPGVN